MNKKKTISFTITVIALAGSLYIYKEYNRKNKDLGNLTPDLSISANDLLKKFETDEARANKTFLTRKDYIVAVGGKVKDVSKDEKGFYTISLGDTADMSSVRCSIDSVYKEKAAAVHPGDNITIQGAVTGFNKDDLLGSDVILNRCAVINSKK
ncbi:MAG: hypothetical protein JST09_00845 [Bacteroidetes bacterium]|nr:hypothetical protein [Bacteroidota bacterium]